MLSRLNQELASRCSIAQNVAAITPVIPPANPSLPMNNPMDHPLALDPSPFYAFYPLFT